MLAWRDGISGYRFILIGIGVSEFMLSLVGYIVAQGRDLRRPRGDDLARRLGRPGRDGRAARALLVAVAVLLPVALLLDRPLRTLELGDDAAAALGARVEPYRLALIAVAIVLVAFATAAAGPIMFVALIAGPIARRLLGPAVGRHPRGRRSSGRSSCSRPTSSPCTCCRSRCRPASSPAPIGAPYLIWLLATTNREGSGG